jgi:hypothetical protein
MVERHDRRARPGRCGLTGNVAAAPHLNAKSPFRLEPHGQRLAYKPHFLTLVIELIVPRRQKSPSPLGPVQRRRHGGTQRPAHRQLS